VGLFNAGTSNTFISELDAALWQSLNTMTSFPAEDLFSSFR
jgi:hypothetical protein